LNVFGYLKNAEWVLMFVSVPLRVDGNSIRQILRKAENTQVEDAVHISFVAITLKNTEFFIPFIKKWR
jgi:hypothetical protein